MTTYAINRGYGQAAVTVEFPGDTASTYDTVFIQPKSKAKIPPGSRVWPPYLLLNTSVEINVIDQIGEPTFPPGQ